MSARGAASPARRPRRRPTPAAADAPSPRTACLLSLLDQAFDCPAWHGKNLRSSLRRIAADEAAVRPGSVRHSIAELVLHAAYWKYAVRRRLREQERGGFPLKGNNWFDLERPWDEPAWRRCVAVLESEHAALREAVFGFPPDRLDAPMHGGRWTAEALIQGAACHDVYHAGQIQMLKRLVRER